jgi:Skp family chaperone for outer membrane proteins
MMEIPFSIYLIIPSSIFILLVGLFVLVKDRKQESRLFFFLAFAQFLWSLIAFIVWQDSVFQSIKGGIILDKLLVLLIFLMPIFLYHFTVSFCKIKTTKLQFFIIYIVSALLVFFLDKEVLVNGIFFYQWGDWGLQGLIHYLFSFFILILLTLPLYNIFKIWKGKNGAKVKSEIIFWTIVVLMAFGIIIFDMLPVYGYSFYPLFYLTIPIYALVMAYIFINKKPLSSIATNDILVIAILTFLSSFIIFPSVEISTIERIVIFFLISILSFLVLKHSNELAEQKNNYEKKIEEGTKAIEAKNAELTEIKNRLENTNSILEKKVEERTKELQGLNDTLEKLVRERTKELERKTKELEEKIRELEYFSEAFMERENKMIELKSRIRELEENK